MLRALAVIPFLLLLPAGCGGAACEGGTLSASLTYDAASRTADTLRVRTTINGATISTDVPYTAQTTVRVPFPGVAYSKGLSVDVVVEARLKGALVATASETGFVLPSSCGIVPLTFGEADTAFSLSGMVSGVLGTGLVVSDGVDSVSVSMSGPLVFPTKIESGASYDVIVTSMPSNPAETCMVTNGTGYIDDTDVTNVLIDCEETTYTIGGAVVGLDSPGMVVALTGSSAAQDFTLSQFGTSFQFSQAVPSGTTYTVTITNPSIEACTFDSNGTMSVSGTVADMNVTDLNITCNNT